MAKILKLHEAENNKEFILYSKDISTFMDKNTYEMAYPFKSVPSNTVSVIVMKETGTLFYVTETSDAIYEMLKAK